MMSIWLVTILALAEGTPWRKVKGDQGHFHPLIVGGRPADQGEVPYQLGLRYNGLHHCGASLVEIEGTTVALTAAHCVPSFVPVDSLTLVGGDISLSDSTGLEQTRSVTKIKVHEGYDEYTYENDIAIVFFNEPFDLNDNVKTIPLPGKGEETTGELFVSGWGKLEHEGDNPDVLQAVVLPVVDHDSCQSAYDALGDEIFDSFLCAGYLGVGGMDACQGDSGGPARSISGGYLAGIVSWGEGCGDPEFPGIYTQVSHFIDWIQDNVS